MSKFVTYPAVTVLDNDHSLLIDSPNAGTNSITANNAADTLLSKWSGFDTFDEAVQNTISNNQEFIDRDTAIRSETADLKRKIVTTFPAKDASGQIATFESEFEDAPLKSCIVQVNPVQDLHGYDHPWPAGGGKNLFQTTATTRAVNGTTFTVNNDGTILVSGTPSAIINGGYVYGEVTLPAGTYKANGNDFPTNALRMTVYNETTSTVLASIYNAFDISFTLSEESVVRVYPFVNTDYNGSAITMKPMIRLASETDASYAPYSNICPISGFTGVEVQRTGFNVWDEEWEVGGMSNSGQPITASDRIRTKNFIHVTPNTAYYFKTGVSGQTSWQLFGCYYDKDKNFISTFYRRNSSLTMPSNCHYIKWTTTGGYGTTYNHNISINYPSTNHDYHPYVGQTYPITFPSEAGTVYGGYVDVINGELVVDKAIVDLGTLKWIYLSNLVVFYSDTVPGMKTTSDKDGKCSVYKKITVWITDSEWTNGDKIFALSGSDGRIRIKDTAYTDASAFKSAMNGVQFCYELAEPIHYPITPTEIKTLLGTNNIWANTGDTSVEYLMSDVGWYVEKKLRAFQSILAGAEDSAVASKNYSTDSYLIFNDDIYRVTKTITAGETIEDGVNVTKTTVAEQLMALAQV